MKERGRKMRQKLRIRWKALKMEIKNIKVLCGVYGTSSIGNPGDDSTDLNRNYEDVFTVY